MKQIAILGVDLQNDFIRADGALPVAGAEDDAKRIADFINNNRDKISHISLTLDYHHPIHIASPIYWLNSDDTAHPEPFTQIKEQDVRDKKWKPRYEMDWVLHYLAELERKGKTHTIWNPHCIMGSEGSAIYPPIMDAVINWEVYRSIPMYLWYKGLTIHTEHFSVFKAEIPIPNTPETNLNRELMRFLNTYDEVYMFGEAGDVCVAESLNDIVNEAPELAKKVIILEDCMSWITPDNPHAVSIFENAKKNGVRFMKSTEAVI